MIDSKQPDSAPVADAARAETPNAPSGPDGTVHGTAGAMTSTDLSEVSAAASGANSGEPSEPDAATRWCRNCSATVRPTGRGMCERCGRFLTSNVAAQKNPIDRRRRQQILSDLLVQFPPSNVLDRASCEHLSTVLEQLETMRPGTPEWQRLIGAAQSLGAALKGETSAPDVDVPDYTNVSDDALIDRLQGILEAAIAARDAKRAHASTPIMATIKPTSTPATDPEPLEPDCPYYHRTVSRCMELKENRLERNTSAYPGQP